MTDPAAIDRYLEMILKAAGSSLRNYEPRSRAALRAAMIQALAEEGASLAGDLSVLAEARGEA